jgi:predicted transcriptional regulator
MKQSKGLSNKQYYLRIRRLLKTGLVQKSKGFFTLTPLGSVVYEAQMVLQNGISNYWKLKAIDSIEETRDFGEQKN